MTQIEFTDEKLRMRLREWLEEQGVNEMSPEARRVLSGAFKSGWAACMESVFNPALDLCLVFMRLAKLREDKGGKLVLDAPVMQTLLDLCREVVGDVDLEALARGVPAVDVDDPSSEDG